jgi:hypothetical protein
MQFTPLMGNSLLFVWTNHDSSPKPLDSTHVRKQAKMPSKQSTKVLKSLVQLLKAYALAIKCFLMCRIIILLCPFSYHF